MSWFGTESAGSCGDSVLSQSGFGSPGEVVCLGGSVAPVGFVSLCHGSQRFQLIRREELQVTSAVWVVIYTRHLV